MSLFLISQTYLEAYLNQMGSIYSIHLSLGPSNRCSKYLLWRFLLISILLVITKDIDSLCQFCEVSAKFKSIFQLRKLRHREIKWLKDEVPSHTGCKWPHRDSSSHLPNTNTMLFWIKLYGLKKPYRTYYMSSILYILVHSFNGQISLYYKIMHYILYKFVCVNV